MRNKYFENDKKVFSFINSEKCFSFRKLIDFLKVNNLPVLERWLFYLLGKLNYIDDGQIEKMYNDEQNAYGGLIVGEIFYWKVYLNNNSSTIFSTDDPKWRLENEGREVNDESLHEKYNEIGWEYVLNRVENDNNCAREKSIEQAFMSMSNDSEGDNYSVYGGPSDGNGGRLDDDFIDDVLGGYPDAIWNID